MYIEYLVKDRNRINIHPDIEDEVAEKLKQGSDIDDILNEYSWNMFDFETLDDVEPYYLTPEENYNEATIEVYDDEKKLIWDNSIKDTIDIEYLEDGNI